MRSSSRPVIAILGVGLTLALLWYWFRRGPVDLAPQGSPPAPSVDDAHPRDPTASSDVLVDESQIGAHVLQGYGSPESDPAADLAKISRVLESYCVLLKSPDPLPLGSNPEITRALLGKNAWRTLFLPTNHPALSADRQLLDRWGTPLFFHALSRARIDVRSAGPDRLMWTEDDLVHKAPARPEDP